MEDSQITREIIDRVARRVGLPLDSWLQDWDLEMVTAKDASGLIAAYDSFDNQEDKSTLMRFIIAAYDNYLDECHFEKRIPSPALETALIKYLNEDWAAHSHAVKYWSCLPYEGNEVDETDGFAITPIMRKLWREHEEKAC
jgi:hypothetical protein